ncbi:hypothetical protein BGZ76_005449 [Entomortierella beljakovae]|nr:hypothetical protein BGZ76_005449 [Entomortierella beljakovae]
METLIKGILAQPTLQDSHKSAAITKLLKATANLPKPDASILLDLGLELVSTARNSLEIQIGDRVLFAVSLAHHDIYWAHFPQSWFENRIANCSYSIDSSIAILGSAETEDEKGAILGDMEVLRGFAEKRCLVQDTSLELSIQYLFVSMFVSLPDTRPLATSSYIEFLVDHLAVMPTSQNSTLPSKNVISLLQQCWENGPDNIYLTISQLFLNLSNDQQECSIGIGRLLQAVPENYTSESGLIGLVEAAIHCTKADRLASSS